MLIGTVVTLELETSVGILLLPQKKLGSLCWTLPPSSDGGEILQKATLHAGGPPTAILRPMSPTLSTLKISQGTLHITRTKTRTDSSNHIIARIITTTSGILIITAITTRITVTTSAILAVDSTVTNLTTTTKSELGTTINSGQTTTTN